MNELYVNCSQMDITPTEPTLLAGYANRVGMSTGIHRPLTTRCAALRSAGTTVCLIANDLLDIPTGTADGIVGRIAEATQISRGNIFLHDIHTHSAPDMESGRAGSNDRFIPWATNRIVENAVRTVLGKSEFQPCSIRYGRGQSDISANRRLPDPDTGLATKVPNLHGANDREVSILQLVNHQGAPIVTLFNYACHPVILGFDSVVVSPDYPWAARETIEQSLGGMAMFFNGAAGNINPRLTDQTDPAVADGEGKKLGEAVLNAPTDLWTGSTTIRIGSRSIQLPYRDQRMTADRFHEEVARRLGEQTEFRNWQDDLRKWSRAMIDHLGSGGVPDSCAIAVAAMHIGPAVFLLSQGEVFVEYQVRAKQECPDATVFFVAYTNGTKGYIPTAEAFDQKGYEVDQAYVYMEEPSPLTPETDEIYMSALRDVIREVL